jgi:hypothetical protein
MKRNYFGFADWEISLQGNGLDTFLCFKITDITDEQVDRPVGVLSCIAIRAGENRLWNAGSEGMLFTGWIVLCLCFKFLRLTSVEKSYMRGVRFPQPFCWRCKYSGTWHCLFGRIVPATSNVAFLSSSGKAVLDILTLKMTTLQPFKTS